MKNKFTIWLIILLVIANIASMSVFWLGRMHSRPRPPIGGGPKDYIIKELGFNAEQQKKYEELIIIQRQKAEVYHDQIKEAKDAFFNLLNDTLASDSAKKKAAEAVSKHTEMLDLLTLEHFHKIRLLCNDSQKKKFDGIIRQVVDMMGRPRPPGPHPQNGPSLNDKPGKNGPPERFGPPPNAQRGRNGPPPDGPDGRMGPPPNGPPPEGPPGDGMPPR